MPNSVETESGVAGNRKTSVDKPRRACARLVLLGLVLLTAACGSEFPVAPAPVATSAVALSGTRYQGTLTLGNGTATSLNMTLIARGLAAGAVNRRTRATASETSVSGNFSTGNGLTGTIQGSLTGSLENGVFNGSLTTSVGQVEERNYSGPVTSTSAAWAPGSCVRNCTPDGLSGAVQTLLTMPDTPPPPCTYGLGGGDRTFEAAGGNGTAAVTATANCAWAAESLASWLTITGNVTGVGPGTVTFAVQANSGSERQGSLRIGGQTFTVTQARGSVVPPPSDPPVITSHPHAVEITSGTSTTLAVTTTSSLPLTYQWYVGNSGVTSNPIGGATATSYTTPALTATTSYWVRVTDSDGRFVNSMAATVTVVVADPEEPPPPPPVITSQPQSVTIASGNSATLTVAASSPVPITFQWFVTDGDGPANPIAGATASTYTTPALTVTTTYMVRVTNIAGSVDSSTATVTVVVPPVITSQPQGATIASGSTTTLSVTATGTLPLAYQWFVGASGVTTNPIGGATSSSFTTPPLTTSTTYWVLVSNAGGPVNSTAATVTVAPPPVITSQPGSATVPPGSSITLSVTASSPLPITYQWFIGASGVTTNPIASATLSSYTTPALTATTSYWVQVANAAGPTNSATATISVANGVLNFDSVSVAPGQCTSATAYLASFKISFEPIRGGASPQICNATGTTITASTPPNVFVGGPTTTNTDAAYDLIFPAPLASVSITRATVDPKTSLPPWTATAFNQAGLIVSRVVQDNIFPGPSAAVFVLNGPGIVRVRIETFNGGGVATYNHPPFDNLILTP